MFGSIGGVELILLMILLVVAIWLLVRFSRR
jgi:hypothetical protein